MTEEGKELRGGGVEGWIRGPAPVAEKWSVTYQSGQV
jgi:hypothetical protein